MVMGGVVTKIRFCPVEWCRRLIFIDGFNANVFIKFHPSYLECAIHSFFRFDTHFLRRICGEASSISVESFTIDVSVHVRFYFYIRF